MGPYFCGVQPIFAGKNGIAVAQPEYSVSWPKSLFSKPRAARARKYSLNLNGQSERLVPHTTANQCFAQFLRWVFQLSPSPSNFHSIRQWPFEWQSRDLSKGFLTSMREPRISVNRRCLWSRRCRCISRTPSSVITILFRLSAMPVPRHWLVARIPN